MQLHISQQCVFENFYQVFGRLVGVRADLIYFGIVPKGLYGGA